MRDTNPTCDFCGFTPQDVGLLLQGNADPHNPAYVCGGCIEQCRELLLLDRLRRSQCRSSGHDRHPTVLSHPALSNG